MLLGFIFVQPKYRYQAIEPFLNLAPFKALEEDLTLNANSSANELNSALESERDFRNEFVELFPDVEHHSDLDSILSITKLCLNRVLSEAELSEVDFETIERILETKLRTLDNSKLYGQVSRLRDNCSYLKSSNVLDKVRNLLNSIVELVKNEKWEDVVSNTELLTLGSTRISATDPAQCPLCDSRIDGIEVLERIKEKLVESETVKGNYDRFRMNVQALRHELGNVNSRLASVKSDWKPCMDSDLSEEFSVLASSVDDLFQKTMDSNKLAPDLSDLCNEIIKRIAEVPTLSSIDERLKSIQGNELLKDIDNCGKCLNVIIRKLPKRLSQDVRLDFLKKQTKILADLKEMAEQARKAAVQELFDQVAATANRFYEMLHPSENIGSSKLEVRHVGEGSAILKSSFHGRTEDPRVHYSESHLDTLGLCFFLAIRKHEYTSDPSFAMLVIDDVVHSVDAQHRQRFIDLLAQHFNDHQIFLTTHDAIFFEYLTRRFNKDMEHVRFSGWSLEHGPSLVQCPSDYIRMSDPAMRAASSEHDICSSIRRFMESFSKEMDERLWVNTRYASNPMLEHLWPPLKARLDKSADFRTKVGDSLDAIHNNRWFGNKWAHDNPDPSLLQHSEALELAEHVVLFHDSLKCDHCNAYIARRDDINWTCNCGSLTYTHK